jgi:hypothetical protein
VDAIVLTLQADVAALKAQVAALLAKLSQAANAGQYPAPALPTDSAAAIAQAKSDIEILTSQIATALTPPASGTGTTGVTGVTGSSVKPV